MGPKARKLTLPLNGLNPQDHRVPLSLSIVSVPPVDGVDVVADGLPQAPTSTASAASMPMIAYRRRPIPNPPSLAISLSSLRRLVKDRKSTRLNSSHSQISYAVFCLKK